MIGPSPIGEESGAANVFGETAKTAVETTALPKAIESLTASLCRPEAYQWSWNEKDNLEGFEVKQDKTRIHRFTWQPHGPQFTIIEDVPESRLAIKIRKPPELNKETILDSLKIDASWVQVIK
jgi:hypothetical protein